MFDSANKRGHRMSPMTKTTMIAALAVAVWATEASAQSRTFYNSSGQSIGRATERQHYDVPR